MFSFFSKPYEGLRPQDLRRLKDMLIVETADMLQAPLFTAEALLRAHGNETHVMLLIIRVAFEVFQSFKRWLFYYLNTEQNSLLNKPELFFGQ